jgi:hypothetical protein
VEIGLEIVISTMEMDNQLAWRFIDKNGNGYLFIKIYSTGVRKDI